jgi:putative addiction module component (TIGR02574 family)
MSEPAKKLLDEALLLPVHDRAALAAELLASLDGDDEEDVEAAWAAEIQRRVERVSAGEGEFEDWDTVRERLRPRV